MATFDDVRRIAMSLPEATEILTWDTDVTFRVGKKIFAIGGDRATHVSIKATPLVQEDLLDRDPETFRKAAYVGRFGWVEVNLDRVDLAELGSLLREAWRMTAPRKLASTLAGD
jgi:hypothetical protein